MNSNIEPIGSGNSASVYQIKGGDSKIYAEKIFKSREFSNKIKEFKIMSELNHPNLMKGIQETDTSIIMEYMEKGSLFDLAKSGISFGEKLELCKTKFKALIDGVKYMHDKNIIHQDIKLENILVNDNYDFVLADFGYSEILKNENELFIREIGTHGYISPERYIKSPFKLKPVDIFALGVTLFNFLAGFSLIQQRADKSDPIYKFILANRQNDLFAYFKNKFNLNFSEEFIDLIISMIHPDPYARIKIDEVCSHKFFMN